MIFLDLSIFRQSEKETIIIKGSLKCEDDKMDVQLSEIGKRVKQARQAKGLSQMELAEAVGISVSFLSNIEVGRQSMNIKTLIAISDTLDVSTDWILRNDTRAATSVTAEEIARELDGCTLRERGVLLRQMQMMKESLAELRSADHEDEN